MRHIVYRYLRKPVAVINVSAILPGAYDGMAVLCDDGAVFFSWPDGDRKREWIEGSPIPGTVRGMNLGGGIPIQENIKTKRQSVLVGAARKAAASRREKK